MQNEWYWVKSWSILESCFLRAIMRNSVLEELRVSKPQIISENTMRLLWHLWSRIFFPSSSPVQKTHFLSSNTENHVEKPMTSRDPKGQTRDPNTLRTQYLENSWRCHLATIANYNVDSLLWGSTRSVILATAWLLAMCCVVKNLPQHNITRKPS